MLRISNNLTEEQMASIISDVEKLDFIESAYYDFPITLGWSYTAEHTLTKTSPEQRSMLKEILRRNGAELIEEQVDAHN